MYAEHHRPFPISLSLPAVFLTAEPAVSGRLAEVVSTLARCRVHAQGTGNGPERRLLPLQGHRWRAMVDLQVSEGCLGLCPGGVWRFVFDLMSWCIV